MTKIDDKNLDSDRIDRSVNAAARTLALLDAFIDRDGPLTLADLEAQTGLFKSVILRYMLSLESSGYVQRRPDGRYRLGVRAYQLGCTYEHSFDLSEQVIPALEWLTEKTSESSSLYIREGNERICLLRKDSPQMLKASIPPGTRLPLDDSATAQVFKRFSGVALERWSLEQCICYSSGLPNQLIETTRYTASMSAPVFRFGEVLVGALTVAGPLGRFDPAQQAARQLLLEAAMDLSFALGARIPADEK
ncbi:MAG: IclR family transcriptional regulator [Janthinobacterium lividum]